jgi:hypothetical protein
MHIKTEGVIVASDDIIHRVTGKVVSVRN